MDLMKLLSHLLPSPLIGQPADVSERKDKLARKVVARNAEGSIRLGQGRYRTGEQVEADFQAVCRANF